jgi:hypothetical protein
VRSVKREAKNPGTSGSGGSGGSGDKGGRGGGRGDRGRGHGAGSGRGPQKNDECRRCGKLGHWARECRAKAKKDQVLTVHEEEASLMTVTTTISESPQKRSQATVATEEVVAGEVVETGVVIHEEKVFVQLGRPEARRDAKIWIVDTGATNHMTGSRAAFINLDTHVRGTVRFRDDSAAEIEGRGIVEFICKNGELRRFEGVYFIPKLTANIVSVGRLDEDGYRVLIGDGKLAIRESGGKLLARVDRTANRLYLLTVKLSIEECLAAHEGGEAWRLA